MTSLHRALFRVFAFSLLAFLSLACCINCPGEPDRNVCSDGAETASLTAFRFLEEEDMFTQSGFVVGGQGSGMLTARFVFEGDDIPGCASVTVSAETVADGRTVWSETAAVETEDRTGGGKQSRGTLFELFEPDTLEDCVVRITATAYGQTAELIAESNSFVCRQPPDGGMEDAAMQDASTLDAGAGTDAGASDAGM